MAEIKYTNEQIEELENNEYIKSCTNKNINFTKEFKISVLDLDKQGIFHREIFKKLGFPEYIYNSRIPKLSLDRWKANINKKGIIEESKGIKKKEIIDFDKMTLEEQNEYLKTKVAYLEELNKLMEGGYP